MSIPSIFGEPRSKPGGGQVKMALKWLCFVKFAWDFRPAANCGRTLPVTSGRAHGQQLASDPVHIGQGKQYLPLVDVFHQPSIAGLAVAKEVLNDVE